MTFLLDTNVLSEIRRPNGSLEAKSWFASVPSASLFISVLTVGEIRRGIELLRPRDPAQAGAYETWLGHLAAHYAGRIIPITHEICDAWGRIVPAEPVPAVDGLLAATAAVRNLILVTLNVGHFERTGVRLLNPTARV